jgi:RNA ligase (TIGR02306 family)
MAIWKVVADKIKLFPHFNSDHLMVGKIGKFQVVVSKDNGYKDGDVVVFAPERSILPEEIRGQYNNTDTGKSYLQGDNHDRVGAVRLRGELSEGVTLPLDWVTNRLKASINIDFDLGIPLNTDLSHILGITKYTPPIPKELQGKVSRMDESTYETRFVHHDVESFHTFKDEFIPGEEVYVTEKLHGSQVNIMKDEKGVITLSSKYLGHDGFLIDYDLDNKYWRGLINSGLQKALLDPVFSGHSLQVIGELLPCHKGFKYGFTAPTIKYFKLILNGSQVPIAEVLHNSKWAYFADNWVPLVGHSIALVNTTADNLRFLPRTGFHYFSPELKQLAEGREQLSGQELHIKEGVVVCPVVPRNNSEGHGLAIKLLNSKFKESPTDFS